MGNEADFNGSTTDWTRSQSLGLLPQYWGNDMDWLAQNWVWLVLGVAMVVMMRRGGHGGGGGCCGPARGADDARVASERSSGKPTLDDDARGDR